MTRVLLVGAGGFLGSAARYLLSGLAQGLFRTASFPAGTLAVNLSGCLVIGVLSQLAEARGAFGDPGRAFLFAGVLGGFTTFSAFGNETVNLLRDGGATLAALNVAAQVGGGLLCVLAGRALAHLVWG